MAWAWVVGLHALGRDEQNYLNLGLGRVKKCLELSLCILRPGELRIQHESLLFGE
jgi:hypothetical protein